MTNKKTENLNTEGAMVGDISKIIPKFCTSINFSLLHSKQIVMSFTYSDSIDQPSNLIERVAIDYKHAKKVTKVLNELIEKAEKEVTNDME